MKTGAGHYDYGKCHICGGSMAEKCIKQDFWVKGKLVVIDGVPAGVCSQCGEKVVQAEVGQSLARLITACRSSRKVRTLSVPVIRFAREVA